ncbi:hypothetical protein JMA_09930 [Jeotgalibacillus malaysiensis]|uniref:Uncharacterized protein n=1 Tax=Jeotgalibacillus malaysiensis TaxID=1508404 RepID=A0A0B5AIZ4_9BACL|nr:hypothetical protein [Jeotgalibacillus malaysiensis]AJD90310.1 hypothetical protein JMA_09930 [Jeotgalibacillus malaysiensis]
MTSKLQGNFRNKNKYLLTLKVLFNAVALFFSLQIIYLSVSALSSPNAENGVTGPMLSGLLFFLALSNAMNLIEMKMTKEKKHFKLLLIVTGCMFFVSIYILL